MTFYSLNFFPIFLVIEKCVLCSSYFVSLLHVLPVVVASLRECYVIITTQDDVIGTFLMPNTEVFKYTSAFLAGYMIYDIIEIARNDEIYDILFFIHHPVSFIGAYIGMQGIYETLILPYYLGEIPVIFINLFTITKLLRPDSDTTILKMMAALNFILFRLSWTFILPYFIFSRCPTWVACFPDLNRFIALLVVFFSLSVLNYYWFSKSVLDFIGPADPKSDETSQKKNRWRVNKNFENIGSILFRTSPQLIGHKTFIPSSIALISTC